MKRRAAFLAFVVVMTSVAAQYAEARGGRSVSADCDSDSDDADCKAQAAKSGSPPKAK